MLITADDDEKFEAISPKRTMRFKTEPHRKPSPESGTLKESETPDLAGHHLYGLRDITAAKSLSLIITSPQGTEKFRSAIPTTATPTTPTKTPATKKAPPKRRTAKGKAPPKKKATKKKATKKTAVRQNKKAQAKKTKAKKKAQTMPAPKRRPVSRLATPSQTPMKTARTPVKDLFEEYRKAFAQGTPITSPSAPPTPANLKDYTYENFVEEQNLLMEELTASSDESDSETELRCDSDPDGYDERMLTTVYGRPRKRLPCDRRKMRKIKLFDPPKSNRGAKKGSEAMLKRAIAAVVSEINKQMNMPSSTGKPSPLEQAFLDASQERSLTFDYDRMKELVSNAKFGKPGKEGFDVGDDAYNDNTEIIINNRIPFVERKIQIILLHECLHNTVERHNKPGNPSLSEETEHTAMALLGDRDEQQEMLEREYNFDYVNENWLNLEQRKKRRLNPDYLADVYAYEDESDFDS